MFNVLSSSRREYIIYMFSVLHFTRSSLYMLKHLFKAINTFLIMFYAIKDYDL